MPAWNDYQEEVAQFFRDLGLDAKTNQTVVGVRTTHAVDVLVLSKHVGIELKWLVECKAWKSRVPKEKVLALRMIVDDTGADRGIMMAEAGYQSGALEAARLTNILLTSLADLREQAAYELGLTRLKTLFALLEVCRSRYWKLDKRERIEYGLRADVGDYGYSGTRVIQAVDDALKRALTTGFPVKYDEMSAAFAAIGLDQPAVCASDSGAIYSPIELFDVLHKELVELDRRLTIAENALQQLVR